ncbi:hypothetical protein O6H91_03G102100 [Diphasiastrum complanatum]|nr:hypothetical protein O6H91_03G102100 [Diphasiastrum complanatum]
MVVGMSNPRSQQCRCNNGWSWQQMKAFRKLMEGILFCGYRLMARSCKEAKTVPRAANSPRLQLRSDNESFGSYSTVSTPKKHRLRRRRMKMGWICLFTLAPKSGSHPSVKVEETDGVGSKARPEKPSNRQARNVKVQLPTVANVQSAPQPRVAKGDLTAPTDTKTTRRVRSTAVIDHHREKSEVFMSEKYLIQDERSSGRKDQSAVVSKCLSSSSFSFQPEELSCDTPVINEVKCESVSYIDGPTITASKSNETGDLVGSMRIKNERECDEMVKEVVIHTSVGQAPCEALQVEVCSVENDHGEKKAGETQMLAKMQSSSKVHWHLAKVNSHEFLMSPTFCVQSTASSKAEKSMSLKERRSPPRIGSGRVFVPKAATGSQGSFSFDQVASAPEDENSNYASKSAVTDNSFREGEMMQKSSADHSDDSIEFQTPFRMEDEVSIRSKKLLHEMACKVNNDLSLERKVMCDHMPGGNGQKQHGSHESDDYQSDMSTDLFEIERLDGISCCSSAPSSPNIRLCIPVTPS